ncbi:hypothetical protein ABPG75_004442 [Micractinium tetrahymenae]
MPGAFLSSLLVGLLAVGAAAQEGVPTPLNLSPYYTAYPAPISFILYLDSGEFALCAYATCVTIPGSNPPVAECGCYSFTGPNLGSATGILNKQIKDTMLSTCFGSARCTTLLSNKTEFCRRMNDRTMYPGYELVSTYNTTDWAVATGQGNPEPRVCQGGTATNCFAAACRRGTPTSRALPPGSPAFNSTCYCPYFTTSRPFIMANGSFPCGPTDPAQVVPGKTLIYNGA